MGKLALEKTKYFYRQVWPDIMILIYGLAGGFVATYFDWLNLAGNVDDRFIYGIYTIITIIISFPVVYAWNYAVVMFTNAVNDWKKVEIIPWNPQAASIKGFSVHNKMEGIDIEGCEVQLTQLY